MTLVPVYFTVEELRAAVYSLENMAWIPADQYDQLVSARDKLTVKLRETETRLQTHPGEKGD